MSLSHATSHPPQPQSLLHRYPLSSYFLLSFALAWGVVGFYRYRGS
jgi:hypothetical protein